MLGCWFGGFLVSPYLFFKKYFFANHIKENEIMCLRIFFISVLGCIGVLTTLVYLVSVQEI